MSGGGTGRQDDGPLRALRVLEALAGMEQPAGLLAIAATTNLTKSKAYRALRSLQDQGFVDHVGHRGYRLGSRSVALATLIRPRPIVLRTAGPILGRLAAMAAESASLNLRSGAHRVLVLGVVSHDRALHGSMRVGERAPLTSGCSGLAILDHLPPAEADEAVKSRPRREKRPTAARLAQIRDDGYALSFSDNHPDLNGIGAPLLDPADGYPLGSVSVAGSPGRLPECALRRLSEPLRMACAELAPQLARVLGPNASERLASLDVTIQDLLEP